MPETGAGRAGKTIVALDKLVPFVRIGKPEEIAAPLAFLAPDEAPFLCGAPVESPFREGPMSPRCSPIASPV